MTSFKMRQLAGTMLVLAGLAGCSAGANSSATKGLEPAAVVVSEGYARRRFGSPQDALGRSLVVPRFDAAYTMDVIEHIEELVVKPANESGGYGLLIGDRATRSELDAHIALIEADPRNWVAQPILALSTVPTLCDGEIEPRHVDLRPFILSGEHSYVTAGGLTRVALKRGSGRLNVYRLV